MKIKYLLYEHVDPAIQDGLRRRNSAIDVLRIGDSGAPGQGASDPAILVYLEETIRTLATQDYATMEQHARHHLTQGGHFNGIFLIRKGTSMGRLIDELCLLWESSAAEEWRDQILWIPL